MTGQTVEIRTSMYPPAERVRIDYSVSPSREKVVVDIQPAANARYEATTLKKKLRRVEISAYQRVLIDFASQGFGAIENVTPWTVSTLVDRPLVNASAQGEQVLKAAEDRLRQLQDQRIITDFQRLCIEEGGITYAAFIPEDQWSDETTDAVIDAALDIEDQFSTVILFEPRMERPGADRR